MSEQFKNFLFSLTILLPAVAALMRYRNADTRYRPFFIYMFYSVFNELLVGLYLSKHSKNMEIVNWEIFNLAECMLLLFQFYYWQRFKRYKNAFIVLIAAFAAGWLVENFVFSTVYSFNPVFLIAYSFVIALLSINTINYLVVNYQRAISKNAMFIICVAFVIFFIYNIVVFTTLATKRNKAFPNVFEIRVYINVLTNILYAIGIYYIPRKTQHRDIFREETENGRRT